MNPRLMNPLTDDGVICVCSRGLIHSRTIRAIEKARAQARGKWVLEIEDESPIPAAQNIITMRALMEHREARWLLFVEEDVVIPFDIFQRFNSDPIQAVNYTLPGGLESIRRASRFPGRILFCGLGCTLIHRDVFEAFEEPFWFSTGYQFTDVDGELVPISKVASGYGGHDIYFCYHAGQLGFPVRQVLNTTALHLRVTAMGEPGKNDGLHQITVLR
jgi:hypothetical protein